MDPDLKWGGGGGGGGGGCVAKSYTLIKSRSLGGVYRDFRSKGGGGGGGGGAHPLRHPPGSSPDYTAITYMCKAEVEWGIVLE